MSEGGKEAYAAKQRRSLRRLRAGPQIRCLECGRLIDPVRGKPVAVEGGWLCGWCKSILRANLREG